MSAGREQRHIPWLYETRGWYAEKESGREIKPQHMCPERRQAGAGQLVMSGPPSRTVDALDWRFRERALYWRIGQYIIHSFKIKIIIKLFIYRLPSLPSFLTNQKWDSRTCLAAREADEIRECRECRCEIQWSKVQGFSVCAELWEWWVVTATEKLQVIGTLPVATNPNATDLNHDIRLEGRDHQVWRRKCAVW